MPSPSPNGISTAMIELRSRARAPSSPIRTAAISEPTSEPVDDVRRRTAGRPRRPANDSSLMPCTANAMSRCITKTPIRPPTMPSTAPAKIEFCTQQRAARRSR